MVLDIIYEEHSPIKVLIKKADNMEFTKEQAEQIQDTHNLMVAMKPMIENHNKTLYGNGREGLSDRVTKLETSKKTMFAMLGVGMFIIAVISLLLRFMK